MSPFSSAVLAGAAILASPALYQAFVAETMPPSVAATRYAVALAVCWAGLSALTALVAGALARPAVEEPTTEATSRLEPVEPG